MASKLERILAVCRTDPDNPFVWYSLAMEQKKSDLPGALEHFERVHLKNADYLPNYYHYAQTLKEAGAPAKAKTILEEGIEVARKQNNGHTLGELTEALLLL